MSDKNNNDQTVLDERHDWLRLIPSILEHRNFVCTEQTMESARELLDLGLLGNFTRTNKESFLSTQVEDSLLESFIEDDYDGALHLTTLDDSLSGRPVGFVFWREIPNEEMKDWIHWENLRKKLTGEQQQKIIEKEEPLEEPSDKQRKRKMRQSLRQVQNESIRWLEVASESSSNSTRQSLLRSSNLVPLMETLTHAWVKLELLAVHPDYWKQRIGTLLMACAMYQAYKRGEDHMILHVAGGKENLPALRLYDKFGFVSVPQGTVFQKPDKDVFVLGHVGESLQRLYWPALMQG